MFTHIRQTKADLPVKSLVKNEAAWVLKALLLVLVILGMMPKKVSAAEIQAPACNPGTFCASINQAQLSWFTPQLVISDATLVNNGPGSNYHSYGDLPAGYVSQVTGISQDGNWLVISLPVIIAPDGKGWVRSAEVTVKNVQATPDWLKHCDPMTYCGYILSNSPQYVPVRQPSS